MLGLSMLSYTGVPNNPLWHTYTVCFLLTAKVSTPKLYYLYNTLYTGRLGEHEMNI